MKAAIAAFFVLAAVPHAADAADFTFTSCSSDAVLSVRVFNHDDPVKMFTASSARNIRVRDQVNLSCKTDQCLVQVNADFELGMQNQVQHTLKDFAPDGGSVCFGIRFNNWNSPSVRVTRGQCSC